VLIGLSFAEDRPETFLLKMPVVGEHFIQAIAPHDLHRNAIRQAIAFIWTRPVKIQAGEKQISTLGPR
jgi:hypothetical protein